MPFPSPPLTSRRHLALAGCAVALLLAGAAEARDRRKAAAPTPPAMTAREAVELQFAAPPQRAGEMSGEEAAIRRELYLKRLGQMLQPQHDLGAESPQP